MKEKAVRSDLSVDRTKEEAQSAEMPFGRAGAPVYAVCSALFAAVALLGLFLGFFMRGSVGALIAGGEPILRGSYLGVIVEVLRGSIAMPKAENITLTALLPVFLYFMTYALALGVLLSITLAVLTALKPKMSRFFCTVNGFTVLFLYGAFCVGGVLLGSLRAEIYSWRQLDLPSLTAVLLALCVFAGMTVARKKWRGAVNVFLLLFTADGVCAFIFPGTPLLDDLDRLGTGTLGMGKTVAMGLLCLFLIANLVLSVLRLERARGQFTDILRFGAQFAAALFLSAAYLAEDGAAEFFMAQPLAVVFLLLSPLAALLLSVFARTFPPKERSGASPEEAPPADAPHETPPRGTALAAETAIAAGSAPAEK